jgi:acetyl-CoA carboxylase biotin carboxyl carrier protein
MRDHKLEREVISQLIELLKENDLGEIEYSSGKMTVRVSTKRQTSRPASVHQPAPIQQGVMSNEHKQEKEVGRDYATHPGAVKSKMVGTCYLSPTPGAPQFISEGQSISEGQPMLIIEAMKVMNIIKAPKSGTVLHIAAKDQSPVEYGQLLVVIE